MTIRKMSISPISYAPFYDPAKTVFQAPQVFHSILQGQEEGVTFAAVDAVTFAPLMK